MEDHTSFRIRLASMLVQAKAWGVAIALLPGGEEFSQVACRCRLLQDIANRLAKMVIARSNELFTLIVETFCINLSEECVAEERSLIQVAHDTTRLNFRA